MLGVGVVGSVQPEVLRQPGSIPTRTASVVIQRLVVQESELCQPATGGHLGMDTVEQVSLQVGLVKEPHIRMSQSGSLPILLTYFDNVFINSLFLLEPLLELLELVLEKEVSWELVISYEEDSQEPDSDQEEHTTDPSEKVCYSGH